MLPLFHACTKDSDLFDLSSYATYLGYFLYIKHTKTKGNEKCSRWGGGGIRLKRLSTYRGSTVLRRCYFRGFFNLTLGAAALFWEHRVRLCGGFGAQATSRQSSDGAELSIVFNTIDYYMLDQHITGITLVEKFQYQTILAKVLGHLIYFYPALTARPPPPIKNCWLNRKLHAGTEKFHFILYLLLLYICILYLQYNINIYNKSKRLTYTAKTTEN